MAYDFMIRQGKTFSRPIRWEAPPYVYRPITAIARSAPVRITCPQHGLIDGWRAAVVSVKGMTELNAKQSPPEHTEYRQVTVIDADTIEFNDVNAADFRDYVSGGYLQYRSAPSLAGYTARMTVRDKVGGAELLSLTSENGRVAVHDAIKTITIQLSAAETAAIGWKKGVYDLELVGIDGEVLLLARGSISVEREITT